MNLPNLQPTQAAPDQTAINRLLVLALTAVAGAGGYFLKPSPDQAVAPVVAPYAPYTPAPYVPPVLPRCPGPNCSPYRSRTGSFAVTCFFCRREIVVTPPVNTGQVGKAVGATTKAATK